MTLGDVQRWRSLVKVQDEYHAILDGLELWDRQTARLEAVRRGEDPDGFPDSDFGADNSKDEAEEAANPDETDTTGGTGADAGPTDDAAPTDDATTTEVLVQAAGRLMVLKGVGRYSVASSYVVGNGSAGTVDTAPITGDFDGDGKLDIALIDWDAMSKPHLRLLHGR